MKKIGDDKFIKALDYIRMYVHAYIQYRLITASFYVYAMVQSWYHAVVHVYLAEFLHVNTFSMCGISASSRDVTFQQDKIHVALPIMPMFY